MYHCSWYQLILTFLWYHHTQISSRFLFLPFPSPFSLLFSFNVYSISFALTLSHSLFLSLLHSLSLATACTPSNTAATSVACKYANSANTNECAVGKFCWVDNTCNTAKKKLANGSDCYDMTVYQPDNSICQSERCVINPAGVPFRYICGTGAGTDTLLTTKQIIQLPTTLCNTL